MKATTTTTTNEEIIAKATKRIAGKQEDIDALYDTLVTAATNKMGYRDVARLAERIAEAEGEQEAYSLIVKHLPNCPLSDIIQDRLLEGADDSWSGRTNDAQRSRYEGLRKGFQSIKYWIS